MFLRKCHSVHHHHLSVPNEKLLRSLREVWSIVGPPKSIAMIHEATVESEIEGSGGLLVSLGLEDRTPWSSNYGFMVNVCMR